MLGTHSVIERIVVHRPARARPRDGASRLSDSGAAAAFDPQRDHSAGRHLCPGLGALVSHHSVGPAEHRERWTVGIRPDRYQPGIHQCMTGVVPRHSNDIRHHH